MIGAQTYWDGYTRRPLSRRRVLGGGALGALTIAAGGVVACSTTPATPTAGPTAGAQAAVATVAPAASPTVLAVRPKYGGTYRYSASSWAHQDPHQSATVANFGGGIGVGYSRLLKYGLREVKLPATIAVSDLAESWEQADETTFLFKLRKGVKWHNIAPVNGREFVAEDVLYSYDRQRTKGFPNADLLNPIVKIEAPDKYTVKLQIGSPSADFILNIAAPVSVIVAKEAVDLKGDLKQGPTIGTGAFIADKIDPTGTTVFLKNPDYFIKGLPYVDRYERQITTDPATTLAALRSGQLDYISGLTKADVDGLKRTNPEIEPFVWGGIGAGMSITLNTTKAPFDDKRVRQAILKAVNAQEIVDTAWDGLGNISLGLQLPTTDWGLPSDELKRLYKQDIDGAKRLLADAGFANGLDLTLAVSTVLQQDVPSAELMAQQLKNAGIRLTIKPVDNTTYTTTVAVRGEFDAAYGPMLTSPTLDAALFGRYHSKGARNIAKFADPRLDAMIERQTLLGKDPAARKSLIQDIQRFIIDNAFDSGLHEFAFNGARTRTLRDLFEYLGTLNLEMDKVSQLWIDK